MNRLPLSLVVLAVGLTTWLAPREARACSCVPPPPPHVALERSSAVFVGDVRGVTAKSDLKREVAFDVVRTVKGVSDDEVTLTTASNSAACGRAFEVGKRYLVYAERGKTELFDHLCTRTALVDDAKHDLEVLDALAKGAPPPPEPKPAIEVPEDEQRPPPSGAAEPAERPAHEEAPATQPAGPVTPQEREPPADAPAGHCAAVGAALGAPLGGPLLPLALLGLCLLPGARLRRRARRRMSV